MYDIMMHFAVDLCLRNEPSQPLSQSILFQSECEVSVRIITMDYSEQRLYSLFPSLSLFHPAPLPFPSFIRFTEKPFFQLLRSRACNCKSVSLAEKSLLISVGFERRGCFSRSLSFDAGFMTSELR